MPQRSKDKGARPKRDERMPRMAWNFHVEVGKLDVNQRARLLLLIAKRIACRMAMSSEKNGQKNTFTCDGCDVEIVIVDHEFTDAWQAAKDKGWRAYKEGEVWKHVCPDCPA